MPMYVDYLICTHLPTRSLCVIFISSIDPSIKEAGNAISTNWYDVASSSSYWLQKDGLSMEAVPILKVAHCSDTQFAVILRTV